MNRKAVFAACLFATLNICTLSARAEGAVQPEPYTYSTQLDIQKVLSISTDSSPLCGVVTAHMNYLDSQGEKRILDYLTFADSCRDSG